MKLKSVFLRLGFLAVAGAMMFTRPAAADELSAFRACTRIENDIERLQCFDDAAGSLTESEKVTETTAPAGGDPAPTAQKTPTKVANRPTSFLGIVEADEKMVEKCEFLGTLVGKSGWGGIAAGAASKGAMRSAMRRAAKMGATHIVIGGFDVGSGVTMEVSTMQGRAYRCPKTP